MKKLVIDKFANSNVTMCYNNNFIREGEINTQLFFNNTKLSRDHGIPLLAGNLKSCLFPSRQTRGHRNYMYNGQPRRDFERYPPRQGYPNQHDRSYGVRDNIPVYHRPERKPMFETDQLAYGIASAIKNALKI